MRTSWAVGFLLAAMLAGCSDSGGGADPLDDPALEDLDVEATSTTGVIRGVVVDAAIRPIAGALVTVPLPGGATPLTIETEESGAFGFEGLQPGTYFVKVAKIGYFEAQQSIDVVAGVSEPPALKVLLEPNPTATPFLEELVFNAFIECSSRIVIGIAVCGAPNIVTGGEVTNDKFSVTTEFSPGAELIQAEAVWQTTQALSPQLYLEAESDPDFDFLGGVTGESPLLMMLNGTELEPYDIGGANQIFYSFFTGPIPVDGSTSIPLGVTVQQEVTLYVHGFFQYLPPEGWRFSAEDVPAPPS